MTGIIIPKTYIKCIEPLIFLAGPIKSAPKWRDEAVHIIASKNPNLFIASPDKRFGTDIQKYILSGNDNYFTRQREWEWHYQEIAAKNGSILFWFPKEEQHHCNKSYGLMTSNEFGHWTAVYNYNKSIKFCIGSDGKFPEWNTFLYDINRKVPDKRVFDTLEDTCEEAIKLTINL